MSVDLIHGSQVSSAMSLKVVFILGSNLVGSYVYFLSFKVVGVELTWNASLQDAHMGEQQGGIEEKKNMASMAAVGGAAVSAAG